MKVPSGPVEDPPADCLKLDTPQPLVLEALAEMPTVKSRYSGLLEFWLILIVPGILDLLGGRGILASLFGALLWGMALVIAAVRPSTQDSSFRAKQGRVLGFICGAWLSYWALSFVESPHRISADPGLTKWLTWSHAGLLTAGLGMVLVLWATSAIWLFQDFRLRQNSWQRRQSKWRLPSLEALAAVCEKSIRFAFGAWGLGLFLAILTAILKWKPTLIDSTGSLDIAAWWLDSKVMSTALLWVALAVGFQLSITKAKSGRWLYRFYVTLSLLFVFFFSRFMMEGHSRIHEPLSWFYR